MWFLCTIGSKTPDNWMLCKQVGLYGINRPRNDRPHAEVGDQLLVWQGGAGYIAQAAVTGPVRSPSNKNEAPWPGGPDRFAHVVPIEVLFEVTSPLMLPFVGNEQSGTGFTKGIFQRGFSPIPEEAAMYVSTALHKKRDAERT
jgi:hypothetical protein